VEKLATRRPKSETADSLAALRNGNLSFRIRSGAKCSDTPCMVSNPEAVKRNKLAKFQALPKRSIVEIAERTLS
jgi:hypothetical protein